MQPSPYSLGDRAGDPGRQQDGDEDQVRRAGEILTDARRSLYRLLAEDDQSDAGKDEADS